MTSKSQIKANRKWNENNLDRLYITVKKGDKEKIRAVADAKGKSLNSYITEAIYTQLQADMGR